MTSVFAFSPAVGDDAGFAVVTERFVCLLSAGATLGFARELFQRLDGAGAQLQDALAALERAGTVERFAVVEMLDAGDRSLRIAVRGRLSLGLDGRTATEFSSPGGPTSFVTEAHDVSALWLSIDGEAPVGDLLSIGRGIVRAGAVAMETGSQSLFPPAVAPRTAERPEPTVQLPVVHAEPEPEHTEESEPEPDLVEADPATLHVAHDRGDEHWILRLPDGNELDADGTIIIGRTSWEADDADEPVRRVSVPSPMRQISGSHLELALVEGELVARDLDSTNGTIVLTPERPPRLLHGGRTTSLQTGDILDLGESFRIVVSSKH